MVRRAEIAPRPRVAIYICDSQISWQRDRNENINVPIYQYLPKGMDLLGRHQEQLDALPCNWICASVNASILITAENDE